MKNYKLIQYKQACKTIDEYMLNKHKYVIIHYACQNFQDDLPVKGDRITSIGILYAENCTVKLFSFANIAKIRDKNLQNLNEEELNAIETEMLEDFFEFVRQNQDKIFIHWRMNNANFGFMSLENRYRLLGHTPFEISESNKLNLSLLMKEKYGENYATIEEVDFGKMYVLLKMNKLTDSKLLTGREEAVALMNHEYEKVDFSVCEKLNAFYTILDKAANNRLKTKSKKIRDIYGLSLFSLFEYIKDNAILASIFSVFGGILASIICKFLGI